MSKKVLSLVLALVMVLGSFSFVSAAKYDDVTGTDYADAVDRLSLLGILEGYPDGTFKPEGQITRAEFAAVAIRAKGLAKTAAAAQGLPTGFEDVPGTFWASGVVGTAAKLGIVNGVGNGLFAPQAPVKYEEAITMLVRALGYEAAAQTRGGYPYGYLIVANEIGLLDDVKGTQGQPATRGIVAQLTDNALEIPMMVQVGFGSEAKWVVSGTKEHGGEEVTLLTQLGFEKFEGMLVDFDTKDDEITLENDDDKITLEVAEDFDFEKYFGLEVAVWYNDDDVVVAYKAKSEALFDAIEVTKTEKEIKLVDANKKYDVNKDALVYINGEEKDVEDLVKSNKYDYAKVVLKDGDVVFLDAYKWNDYIIVEKVDEYEIFGYGEELDLEDYTIVKDGASIEVEDLEEGDIVFYNSKAEYAEVFNKSVEGEIEEIFNNEFEVAGESFDYVNHYDRGYAKYVNEDDKIANFDKKAAEQMEEAESKVVVFMDRAGNAVFVSGDLGEVAKTTFGGLLYKDADVYEDVRGRAFIELKVVNEEGKAVTYDFRLDNLETFEVDGVEIEVDDNGIKNVNKDAETFSVEGKKSDGSAHTFNVDAKAVAAIGSVVEITVDEDGDVIGLGFFTTSNYSSLPASTPYAESGDRYIQGMRMNSDVPVFVYDGTLSTWDDEDVEVTTYGELEDDVQLRAGTLYHNGSKALYLVVTDSNITKTTEKYAVLTEVRVSNGDITRIKALVDNKVETYYVEKESTPDNFVAGNAVILTIIESNNRVKDIDAAPAHATFNVSNTFTVVTADRKVEGKTLVSDGYIYDISDPDDIEQMSFSELKNVKVGTPITLVKDGSSNTYIKFVLVGSQPTTTPPAGITFTYNDSGTEKVVTVANLVFDTATTNPDNTYLLRISGDALTVAVYTADETLTSGQTSLDFDVDELIPANGIYKVELLSAKDYRVVETKAQLFLPATK